MSLRARCRTPINNGNTVLPWQMITADLYLGVAGYLVLDIVALPLRLIPDRHSDNQRHKIIQCLTQLFAVGCAWSAVYPISHRRRVVSRVIRIHIRITVAGWGEAADEGVNAVVAAPGEPAEVAGAAAVEDVF